MKSEPTKNKIEPAIVAPKRKVSQMGKWVYRTTKSTIVTCTCGNKYISTRVGQTTCLICARKK